ncbi:MAG: carboxy terminal-processing peptidase [Planctomycetaceae bacterium]|jgi:carboxyl-terminal processing protease|nr:carboxy terminal-processing peptidase [Planctomycetaceae bacterium]
MTYNYFRQTIFCILFSSLLFLTACQREISGQPLVPPNTGGEPVAATSANSNELLPLVPGIRERIVAQNCIRLLEQNHISLRKLDTAVSREALRLYIKSLDPLKLYFYQSDIDKFKTEYENTLCDLAKKNNISPAFEIYNCYLDRIKERVDMILKILDTPQDFTLDEEIVRDKSKDFTLDEKVLAEKGLQHWPKTSEEAYDRWRKRIKSDILALKSEAHDQEKERQKAIAEGKEPKKIEQRDPIERLQKRYLSFRKRMLLESHIANGKILDDIKKAANDDVMEAYLSAISGALDPHTSYLSPKTLEDFNNIMRKALEGIGATLTLEDGYTVVKKLVKNSPADKSGNLKANDKITGVGQGKDGKIEDVVDSKLSDVVKLIRGAKGTVVRLELLPADGTASKIIEIVRDKVNLEDQAALREVFEAGQKSDGTPYKIGVIELPDFYLDMNAFRRGDPNARSTTTDVKKLLKEFVEENVDLVVLDLKSNGGGSLQEAIALTGLFIESGNVVQTKDETSSRPQQRDDFDPNCDWTGPLVVVASKLSASASEIFAGAIKDYKRGLIVGDSRTHGKGTVQHMRDLSEDIFNNNNVDLGAVRITVQGFYRPSGVSPQREGVAADVIIPSYTDVLEDICESDLDNALTLNKVSQARNFQIKTPYVTPQINEELQKRSTERVLNDEEFKKRQKEIAVVKELRSRKTTTLNETKFFEEQERLNSGKTEKEELEDLLESEGKIKRNYYLEEVLSISIDYLEMLQKSGIVFPKERTVVQKSSPLNILFGR